MSSDHQNQRPEDRRDVNQSPDASSAPGELESPEVPSPEGSFQAVIAERDANWEKYLRVEAELDNYRRRVTREREEERRYACLNLIRDLLPSLDNLQRAIEAGRAAKATESTQSLIAGVEMVLRQVEDVFTRYGARPIPSVGETFDPHLHEAIQQVPTSEMPPMTVLQEVERGFTLHDRVVRPSKVLVAAPPK